MRQRVREIIETMPKPRDAMMLPTLALGSVTAKNSNGIYASSDTLFKGAIFGRDSLEVADDLMTIKPSLVKSIIYSLSQLQGSTTNNEREEEPGKIIHEYRKIVVDKKKIKGTSLEIFNQLSSKWGGNDTEMAYYGSIDSTPHFLKVVGSYCEIYGNQILDKKITLNKGEEITINDTVERSLLWLLNKLDESKSGLLEFKRANPHGILNQVWKDSDEFYVHENKELANHKQPISSIEVQALAYDGLIAAAKLLPKYSEDCFNEANKLRDRTIELLWQSERNYFALGTDFNEQGNLRVIETMTANPAALLDSAFFSQLDNKTKQKYVTAIVEKIMSHDFLTDAGIRSRALSEADLIDFWDYHGSYVSWPKETYDIAKGLRRWGMERLARQLENRILNIIFKNREYPEFIYIDGWGRVYTAVPSKHTHGELTIIESTNKPERIQAWTVSAVMAIVNRRLNEKIQRKKPEVTEDWQAELDRDIANQIPRVNRHINPIALNAKYPTYKYKLNRKS